MNKKKFEINNTAEAQGVDRATRIRELNDTLRCTGRGGMVLMTNGIASFGRDAVDAIFEAVADFNHFNADNDPCGEHDCGILKAAGQRVLFKIDYYDRTRTQHSPDPSNPKVTVRVMTVMLASEY